MQHHAIESREKEKEKKKKEPPTPFPLPGVIFMIDAGITDS